jgi:hypothetical protein
MREPEHPANRPTRYHWAAGLNRAHLGVAALGWAGVVATGVAGVADPIFSYMSSGLAMATLAWHGVWLLVLPSTPRFKRLTDAQLNARYEHDYGFQLAHLFPRVHRDLADKVETITRIRDRAREIMKSKFGSSDPFAVDNLEKLDTLAISYLQLLVAITEYDEYLSLVDPSNIEHDLQAAQTAVAQAADGTLKAARQRQVELLTNRLARYHQAEQRIELIREQCRNLETTMKLLVDQAMTAADSQRVGQDIDEVLRNIRESEVLTEELATYDDLERELDSIRGHDLEREPQRKA